MRPIILTALLLAGCVGTRAIEPQPFTGPNGKTAYTMRCSGFGRTMAACYQEVSQLCPGGYNILSETHVAQQIDVDFAVVKRTLTVECK